MVLFNTFSRKDLGGLPMPNFWDGLAFFLVAGLLFALGWSMLQMTEPFVIEHPPTISLSVSALPYYAFRSVMRMFYAMLCSLLFTLTVGTLAAKIVTQSAWSFP